MAFNNIVPPIALSCHYCKVAQITVGICTICLISCLLTSPLKKKLSCFNESMKSASLETKKCLLICLLPIHKSKINIKCLRLQRIFAVNRVLVGNNIHCLNITNSK